MSDSTPPVRFTRLTTDGGLLAKSISLKQGKLKKISCAQPRSAEAETCEATNLKEFAALLDDLLSTQDLVYGVMARRQTAPVITDAQRSKHPDSIARKRQFFEFAAQPGVMMFDHDRMQDKRSIAPEELHVLLVAAIPPLAGVRML